MHSLKAYFMIVRRKIRLSSLAVDGKMRILASEPFESTMDLSARNLGTWLMTHSTCALLYRDVLASRSYEPLRETTRVVSRLFRPR